MYTQVSILNHPTSIFTVGISKQLAIAAQAFIQCTYT